MSFQKLTRALDPDSLVPLFRPRSVAIIGASDDPNKVGGRPLHFLSKAGYSGAIYPVNPRGGRLQDLQAYRSLAEIDGGIDRKNIEAVVAAGAEIIVAGSAIFGTPDAEAAVKELRNATVQWV